MQAFILVLSTTHICSIHLKKSFLSLKVNLSQEQQFSLILAFIAVQTLEDAVTATFATVQQQLKVE